MSRKKGKLRPFVPLQRHMLKSPAWRNLSSKAKVLYIYLRFNSCGVVKRVSLPYSSMADMMSTQTMSNGLKELQKAGFIKQVSKGGMFGSPAIYDFVGPYADPFESGRRH